MNENNKEHSELSEEGFDEVSKLLAQDAKCYPVVEVPWFAAHMASRARSIEQERGLISRIISRKSFSPLRWLLPIPLAGVAAIALVMMQHGFHSGTFSSSESEFEQHIEMFASSDYTQDYFSVNNP